MAQGGGAVGIAVAVLLCTLRPLSIALPSPGLDEAWIAVVGQAATVPTRWGVDLAFTYGPASALITRFYTDAYLVAALPILCLVALVQGAALIRLVEQGNPVWRYGILVPLLVAAAEIAGLAAQAMEDQTGFYFVFALTLVLLDLVRRRGDRGSLVILAAGAAAMGVLSQSKTSFGVVALVLFGLADLRAALTRERLPLPTPVFLAAALVTFLVLGQHLGDLPAALDLQIQAATGYGEAMYLVPHRGEVVGFLLGAAILLAAAGLGPPAGTGGTKRASAVLATAFVLALGFKAGFVRADIHTQIAWSILGLAGLVVGSGLMLPRSPTAAAVLGAASLVVLWVVAPLFLLANTQRDATDSGFTVYRDMAEAAEGEASAWARFLRSPAGFAAEARAAKAAGWAAIRTLHPLPALPGGVDMLPPEQSAVLAAGLDYRPRPSFEAYSTYTAGLIAANAAFYAGPDAPAWVLFDAGALDDRYPTSAEGPLWPDLLKRYEPVRRVGPWLALHRRAMPLSDVLGPPLRVEVPLGSTVRVPVKGPVFVRITVTKTWLGDLAAAIFRPPALRLKITPAVGATRTYRFIPAIGAGGFLLSPIIVDRDGFADLGLGAPDLRDGADVESLSVSGSGGAAPFYGTTMSVVFQPVTVTPAPPSPDARALVDDLTADLPWRRLVHALGRDEDLAGHHLSAPAASAFAVPVAGARRLHLRFGIEDGAWTDGQTQGVCFAVTALTDAVEPLWRRCLDPKAVPADRGPQAADVTIAPDLSAVTLATHCPKSCDWGWSYWSAINPEQ